MSGSPSQSSYADVGRLDGRTAIVTGAGNGIGREIAICFSQRGATVFCTDIDADSAQRCASQITSIGGQALARKCDVTSPAQVLSLITEASGTAGGLRILVNNAAAFPPMSGIVQTDDAQWQRTIDVNLTGVFNLCRAALEVMRRTEGGSIVNVASQLAHVGSPGRYGYAASKAAVVQLTKTLALDHAADGIRVNSLSPGPIASDRVIARYGGLEQTDRRFASVCPLGRAGRPSEIARAALFLASDDSSFMTGADLLVDGGYTAH